jgi:hypothetical protein
MNAMHMMFAGTTQCVAAVGARGPFDEQALRDAIAEMQDRHEVLRCAIALEGGTPFFVRDDRAAAVHVVDDVDWQVLYQSLNSTPLPLEPPPWAVHVARRVDRPESWEVLLVTHHALMDGQSIALFLHELLARYAHRLRTGQPLPMRPPRPLAPAAEAMLPRTLSWQEFEAHGARLAERQPKIAPDPHRELAPLEARTTKTRFLRLGAGAVAALTRTAAESGTTLNSWVAACLLGAIERHSPGRALFALGTAFSLRALCDGLEPEDLGCHLSVLSTFHEPVGARTMADCAREHARLLGRAVLEGARHPAIVDHIALRRSLELLHGIGAFVGDAGYTYAESGLESRYPPVDVDHFFASASRALGAASLVLHGLRQGGEIHFTMNHTSPLQSDAWVDATTRTFATVLASSIARQPSASVKPLDAGWLAEVV